MIGELVSYYSPSLERDPLLVDLVLSIANRHFKTPEEKANTANGGLMDMITGLLGAPPSSGANMAILDAD